MARDWYLQHIGGNVGETPDQVAFGKWPGDHPLPIQLIFHLSKTARPSAGSVLDRIGFSYPNVEQKLASVLDYIDAALSLLERPGELYRSASDEHRRLLNQAVFRRIFVYVDEITDVEFHEPFDVLLSAEEAITGNRRFVGAYNTKATPENRGGSESSVVAALVNIASGDFSSNADMVGPEGLEPSTRGLKVRCSTD